MSTYSDGIRVKLAMTQPKSWLTESFQDTVFHPPHSTYSIEIEKLANETDKIGAQPLWEGYSTVRNYPWPVETGATRIPDNVRISGLFGDFFTWLVVQLNPNVVVEFGTAFGVSGMYWLAGLETNGSGNLLTFEPNEVWANIAMKNLAAVSNRFELIIGTFEENIDNSLPISERIKLAFIDAIHTSEFVIPQFELVAERLTPNAIVVLDDIDFSQDMRSCWENICRDNRIAASAELEAEGHIVGIVEFRSE